MHTMISMSFVTIVGTEVDNEYPKTESVLPVMAALTSMVAMPAMPVPIFYIYRDKSNAFQRYDGTCSALLFTGSSIDIIRECVIGSVVMPSLIQSNTSQSVTSPQIRSFRDRDHREMGCL